LTTKIHLAVDGRGRPLRFVLTAGQRNDITQAPALLAGFRPAFVLADRGYDSRTLVASIEAAGATAVIPPRTCQQPRPFDKARYRMRYCVERCFGRLKQYRRIATRYDRNAANFLAFLCLAALSFWVN
jgi:transposase